MTRQWADVRTQADADAAIEAGHALCFVDGGEALDLSDRTIDTIRCVGAMVGGSVDLRGATVRRGVLLIGATVEGDVYLTGATVGGGVDLPGTTVEGELDLYGATVEGCLYLHGATVRGAVHLHGATLRGGVHLGDWALPGGDILGAFARGPMLALFDACPGDGRAAARKAWGNTTWEDCPLHAALGTGSYEDVDELIDSLALRLYARIFVPLHDDGILEMPQTADA